MHIPGSMLNQAVCPVTLAVGAAGVGLAGYLANRSKERSTAARFAAVTSLIFALQMLNYPVENGTSGHVVGAMLGVSLLGVPFAVLAMTIVLAVQAFFFGDGGVNALGANVINMAFLGAGLSGVLFKIIKLKSAPRIAALGLASWFSVMIAALACSFEVALSGAVSLNKVLPAMLWVHAFIGFGEAALTVLVFQALSASRGIWKANEKTFAYSAAGMAVLAALLSPFASTFPDGLERVAQRLSFAQFQGFQVPPLFPDYQVSVIPNASLATILAGLLGVCLVFILTFAAGRALKQS